MWEKELVDILEEERKLLEKILEKEYQKKEYLLSRDISKVLDINFEEERIFNEIEKYEFARNELLKRVSQRLGIMSDEITLSKIIEFSSNKNTLENLKNLIISIISDIKMVSYENRILIESSMNVSLSLLEKITNSKASSENYNTKGQKEIKINLSTYSTMM